MSKAGQSRPIRLLSHEVKGGDLTFRLAFDDSLARYFRSDTLRLTYDQNLEGVDPGLLVIPFVTTVVAVAWAAGADIEIPVADQRFLDSIGAVREVMKSWYPKLPFLTSIHASDVRRADPGTAANEGLLYSGGLDSTASLIRHLGSKPVLILVLGTPDLPAGQDEFQRMFLQHVNPFVARLGLKLHVVRSSMLELLDLGALNEDFGDALKGYWWESIGHGLMLLGACAPLTAVDEIGVLRIAASRVEEFEEPWGSNPATDEKLAWGRTSIVHDSHDMSRQRKVDSLIAPFLKQTGDSIPLRVCGSTKSKERLARQTLNCGICEKCVRSIVGLLAAGVDPKTCGFDMQHFSAQGLRHGLEDGRAKLPKSVWDLWVDIQNGIKEQKGARIPSPYDSGPFLEWLGGYDLGLNLYRPSWAAKALGGLVPRFDPRRRSLELIQDFKLMSTAAPGGQN